MFVKTPGLDNEVKHETVPKKVVEFKPRYVETIEGLRRPECSLACGSSACSKSIKKGKCPGNSTQETHTCTTYRYVREGTLHHARYSGGTVLQMTF